MTEEDPFESNRAFPSFPQHFYPFLFPPYAMSQEHRTLWCLVDGDSKPFKVYPAIDTDVSLLKKLVHEECIDASKGDILAKDLVLCKVCHLYIPANQPFGSPPLESSKNQ
jgi:hypothetical protein